MKVEKGRDVHSNNGRFWNAVATQNKSNATKKEQSAEGGKKEMWVPYPPTVIYSRLERGEQKKSEKLKTNYKDRHSWGGTKAAMSLPDRRQYICSLRENDDFIEDLTVVQQSMHNSAATQIFTQSGTNKRHFWHRRSSHFEHNLISPEIFL